MMAYLPSQEAAFAASHPPTVDNGVHGTTVGVKREHGEAGGMPRWV